VGCQNTNTDLPIAIINTPASASGHAVQIFYVLRNTNTVTARILPLVSVDNGRSYVQATEQPGGEGINNLEASPGGTQHIFLWNSVADVGTGLHQNVIFRIMPFAPQLGTIATSFGFPVDNTDIFVRASDLAIPREFSAAAETADGGVIVAGGAQGFARETELFVPQSATAGAFALAGDLAEARDSARGATLISQSGTAPEAAIEGGVGAAGATGALALFDSATGQWTDPALSGTPRTGHTLSRLASGSAVLAAGGTDGNGNLVPTDDVLDIGAQTVVATSGGVARTGHTATVLPDGRVFVAGGTPAGGAATASTLFYNPAANAFTPGPSLLTARTGHAAAFIGGRLVVAGGRDVNGVVLASVEILAPDLSAFDVTRDANGNPTTMITPRADLTASPIGATDVLLAGGTNGGQVLASAERFTLASGTFVATREGLAVPRAGHVATVFSTGKVLITGGGTTAAEVYIPQSRSGSQTFDPEATTSPPARAEHAAATLLDGRVLLTGGTDGIVAASTPSALASADIWDPNAVAVRVTPTGAPMTTPRRRHTSTTLIDGTVLIAGGLDAGGAPIARVEVFDPVLASLGGATFTAITAQLPIPVADHTATRLTSGAVLLAGGSGASGPVASAVVFTPSNAFSPGNSEALSGAFGAPIPLAVPRARHTATLLPDGRVLITGGLTAGGVATATAEIFDPTLNGGAGGTTPLASTLPGPRLDHRAVLLDTGKVLILGGRPAPGGAALTDGALFDPTQNTLAPVNGALPEGRAEFGAIAEPGGRMALLGGVIGAAPGGADLASPVTAGAFIFDPIAGAVTPLADPSLTRPRRGMATTVLNDGRILLSGGRDELGAVVSGLEVFAP
jgi:hypothetical protein